MHLDFSISGIMHIERMKKVSKKVQVIMKKIKSILENEFSTSKSTNQISDKLKKVMFCVVSRTLSKVYGENYSTRCLQSSIGIMSIFEMFEIKSLIVEGAVCFATVYGDNPYKFGWSGFWGQDHHYWVMSQFSDIIDLSISQLHIHPSKKISNQTPLLPVWWSPVDVMPSIFRYLPKIYGKAKVGLEGEEKRLLEEFKRQLRIEIESGVVNIEDIENTNILTGLHKLDELYVDGNIWIRTVLEINEMLAFPEWIQKEEKRLIEDYYRRNK